MNKKPHEHTWIPVGTVGIRADNERGYETWVICQCWPYLKGEKISCEAESQYLMRYFN